MGIRRRTWADCTIRPRMWRPVLVARLTRRSTFVRGGRSRRAADATSTFLRGRPRSPQTRERPASDAVRFAHDRDHRPRAPVRARARPARPHRPAVRHPPLLRHRRDDGERHQPRAWASPTSTRRATIVEAGVESLREGRTHYTSNFGTIELRRALSAHLERLYGVHYDPTTEILITVGASEAVDLALRATCDPGDEVILHEPSYVAYEPAIVFAGGTVVHVATRFEDDFALDPGGRRGGDHPQDEGAVPGLPGQPHGRRPRRRRPGRARRGSPSATTCWCTPTRSTTASRTARTAIARSARCPACANGRS